MDLSGKRLGHIRVERVLGAGGMGDVYMGFDEKLMRPVALKALHRGEQLDGEARARLIREARALSQLEHPNICRIHDYMEGPEGDVLVLELIEGRTLEEAIREGLGRTERLRIAHDIAEVLVAAHRAGVVHRDLKPDNVMLTRSGEVKVLDFGLARWVDRSSGSKIRSLNPAINDPRLHAVADAPNATAAGLTVGTPMFMSPEQARGEPLTPASDMYSFGLLLQALFTSADPYPSEATGSEVMMRAARGESLPVAGVERDVAVLISALKSLAPTDRPTAVAAAAKLKSLMDAPKRRTRNALLAVILMVIVLGVWKYTVDLRRERAAAVAARQEAFQRRRQAEELVGFMVGDLRKKLAAVGRLDVLDAAATKALNYAGTLHPEELGIRDLLLNSEALNQLGDVRMGQARWEEAMVAFRRSLEIAAAAAKRDPNDASAKLAVGTAHFWIGYAWRQRGDYDRGLAEMTAYLNAAEELAGRYPDNEQYQLERGYGHSNVATMLEGKTQLRPALEHYMTTLTVKQAYSEGKPEDLDRRFDISITLNHIGFVRERLGELRTARNFYLAEAAILDTICTRDPRQVQWKQHLATNHSYLGSIAEAMGDDGEALRLRHAEVEIERSLVRLDAANMEWKRNLAITEMNVGDLLRRAGDLPGALASIGTSERLIREVIATDAARIPWQRNLGVIRLARARALLADGNRGAAISAAEDAHRLLAPAAEPSLIRYAAEADVVRGDALRARGDLAAARAAWERARGTIEPVARAATEPAIIDIWCRTMLRLGDEAAARPLAERLAAIGYRPTDLVTSLRH
ncbi:MAG TPA: protein kinase [Thermoanaerobaculia bacterium]|jgi:tRNA A-37 threonylcarbamoyl transferase component Bud32/tetratricopeptide (TPR) repeat protein|nr:protein kinase [Thermoanaerobaculia bacterium]